MTTMKRISLIALTVLTLLAGSAWAQSERSLRFGIGAGAGYGINEAKDRPVDLYVRGLVRYPFSEMFTGEFSIGYLQNHGENTYYGEPYKTSLIPIEWHLLFSPISNTDWFPYVSVGAGLVSFNASTAPTKPVEALKDSKNSGMAFFTPIGIGVEYTVSDHFSLDLHVAANPTFSDDINPLHDDKNDGYWTGGLTVIWRKGTLQNDDDGDGLSNEEERQLGTDPRNSDSDGDGLSDGKEVKSYKTDPRKADTDGDGLNDGDEVNKYKTDPLKADTDGDGLRDGDEVTKYLTDPTKPDTDGDGLSDGDEVNQYKTDPLKVDTDNDGLSDGDEILKYKTKATNPDTDGDGLPDGAEVTKYRTNPLDPDSDHGTVNDGTEVNRGTNPLDAADDVPKKRETLDMSKGKKLVLEGVEFETGKAEIKPESEQTLNKVLNTFQDFPELKVEVSGHTDNVGQRGKNTALSLARAQSVKEWLVTRGIAADRMTTKGYGPDRPIAPNDTPENKQKNRRIEFERK
jgi:outer membrane protein OmpA-like peptidoglycan-associated protein/opacity protein-like surface antigen